MGQHGQAPTAGATLTQPKPRLEGVTLCAVDTRSPELAAKAMQRCLQEVEVDKALLFTDRLVPAEGLELRLIDPLPSAQAYSTFMLSRLVQHLDTRHVLVVQWDGFVLSGAAWEPGFLQTDYLGAAWGASAGPHRVGNGGFSLRSRRLLQALTDPSFAGRLHHPEDVCIGQTLRAELETRHGIVFGTLAQAERFAFENEVPPAATFGFHGLFNLGRAVAAAQLPDWLAQMPDPVVCSRDAFKLGRNLLRDGQHECARLLMQRRRALGMQDLRLRLLALRHGAGVTA